MVCDLLTDLDITALLHALSVLTLSSGTAVRSGFSEQHFTEKVFTVIVKAQAAAAEASLCPHVSTVVALCWL